MPKKRRRQRPKPPPPNYGQAIRPLDDWRARFAECASVWRGWVFVLQLYVSGNYPAARVVGAYDCPTVFVDRHHVDLGLSRSEALDLAYERMHKHVGLWLAFVHDGGIQLEPVPRPHQTEGTNQ